MKAQVYEDSGDDLLTRVRRLKCVHCLAALPDASAHGGTVPAALTCLLCGKDTEPRVDIPLKEIKVTILQYVS